MAEEIQKKKISDLPSAVYLADTDVVPVVQGSSGSETTRKADFDLISTNIAESRNFSNLATESKTLVGAINELDAAGTPPADDVTYDNSTSGLSADNVQGAIDELAQGGGGSTVEVTQVQTTGTKIATITVDSVGTDLYAPNGGGGSAFHDLTDVDIDDSTLTNGQVPVYNATSEKWENGTVGGSGGHTITDEEGTSFTQRENLQFNGTYIEDNSTDNATEVNVIRSMTKVEFDLLSDAEKVGLINITDEVGGGLKYVKTTLFENVDEGNLTVLNNGDTILLSDNILDYDEIYFEGCFYEATNATGKKLTHLAVTKVMKDTIALAKSKYGTGQYEGMFDVAHNFIVSGQTYCFMYCLKVPTDNSFYLAFKYVNGWNGNSCTLTRIIGIKYLNEEESTYSTDEQIVGKWIDGSTVYEKTFNVGTQSNADQSYNHNISNLGVLIDIKGSCTHSSDGLPLPYVALQGSYSIALGNVSSTQFRIQRGSGLGTLSNIFVTIRYTKSSS